MRKVRWLAFLAVFALIAAACDGQVGEETTTTAAAPTTEAPDTPDTTEPTDGFEGLLLESGGCDAHGGIIDNIEATGEHEVVFNLCQPDPAFLQKLAFIPFHIQPAEHWEATGGSTLDNPIGTGPFTLDVWDRGSEIVFSRYDDYWGEAPSYSTLVFRWNEQSTARVLDLQTGNADFVSNLAASDYPTVQDDPNLVLLEFTKPNVFYIGFQNVHEPFDDVRVRQAVAMGIDRQRIVDTFYQPGSEVASHFTPCEIVNGCEGEAWYDFDPEAGRALLEEAGFPNGFETTIFLRVVDRDYLPDPLEVAQEIQAQLAANLGITATVEEQESGAFIDNVYGQDAPGLHLLGWTLDYPHVTNFLDFHFGGASTQFGDPIPDVAQLLAEGSAIIDPDEAAPIYEQANNLLRAEVPMIPVAHAFGADAALASVENAKVPVVGAKRFDQMTPEGDTLVSIQAAEPISFACNDETDGETFNACEQVLETLYDYDVDTGEPLPHLAEACVPNEEGTVWTCSLRQGVTFHDGSALDANDVVVSFTVGLDASSPLHTGRAGDWAYYGALWGLINE